MPESTAGPILAVSVYSDYICPFCYIGFLRLEKLRAEYPLDVDWRFLEIHPDTPPEGKPVSELGYPREHWQMLVANLARMAAEEGVELPERRFTTNSRRALRLAQATRELQPDAFAALNRALYEAYFLRGENIGDPRVLRKLAQGSGVAEALVERAAGEARFDRVLEDNQRSAAALGINGTPTWVFGERVYSGAVPLDTLRDAAAELRAKTPSRDGG